MLCFGSLKPSKPRKNRNSEANQLNHNNDNQHSTSTPYRHVTAEFTAQADDELSVLPNDIVIFEYTDKSSGGNWSYVVSLRTQKTGFVPSEILSAESRTNSQCKKKIPRSTVDPIDHHSHIHRVHHVGDQPSSNDDNVLLQHQHVSDHQPRFSIPHSLQGSSSTKQSLMMYPNLGISGNSSTPYYNQPSFRRRQCGARYERNEPELRPFHRGNYGLYIVLHNFVSREENDLSVNPGEFVSVLNKEDEDWYWVRRECDRKEGFVPSRFIYDYEQVKYILNKGNSTVTMKSSNHNDCHTYANHGPERESLLTDQQSSLCHQHI